MGETQRQVVARVNLVKSDAHAKFEDKPSETRMDTRPRLDRCARRGRRRRWGRRGCGNRCGQRGRVGDRAGSAQAGDVHSASTARTAS